MKSRQKSLETSTDRNRDREQPGEARRLQVLKNQSLTIPIAKGIKEILFQFGNITKCIYYEELYFEVQYVLGFLLKIFKE